MCYSVKALVETQLKRAKRHGDQKAIEEIQKKLLFWGPQDYHVVSGFEFPALMIYTSDAPYSPLPCKWGLVPHWIKDQEGKESIRSKTLNARGETMFEKPSFRGPAKYRRALLPVDGFYEYHHYKSKSFPYFLKLKSEEPMMIAAIWDEWADVQTGELLHSFSIVTTRGNSLLAKIHNNPKLKEPRMPLVLQEDQLDFWLHEEDPKHIQKLIQPNESLDLESYTVQKLKGKNALGNVKEASEKFDYPEFNTNLSFDF